MKYYTRRYNSSRTSKPLSIELSPNYSGQGGFDHLSFFDGKRWHIIQPESIEDVKALMSQAHILHHNFGDNT